MASDQSTDRALAIKGDKYDHLITMITHQTTLTQEWVKHLVTIQVALFIAFWFISKDVEKGGYINLFLLLTPIFGIVTALVINLIIVRERKWHKWFTKEYSKSVSQENSKLKIPPTDDCDELNMDKVVDIFAKYSGKNAVNNQSQGYISLKITWLFTFPVILAWAVILLYTLYILFCCPHTRRTACDKQAIATGCECKTQRVKTTYNNPNSPELKFFIKTKSDCPPIVTLADNNGFPPVTSLYARSSHHEGKDGISVSIYFSGPAVGNEIALNVYQDGMVKQPDLWQLH